jgi:hypothetical protein
MRTILVLGLLAVLAPTAEAQTSIWLQRGVNGFGGGVQLGVTEGATSLGVSGGYSYQGWLDFGLGVAFTSHGEEFFPGAEVTSITITPGIEYHPLKQSDNLPFSLGLGVNVGYTLFSAEEFDAVGFELEGYSLAASANVYRFFRLGARTGIIPAAGLGYIYGHLEANDGSTANTDFLQVAAGIYLAYLDSSNRIWGLVPAVQVPVTGENNDPSFTIALVLIFSQPPAE